MPRASVALVYIGGAMGVVTNRKTGTVRPIESVNEIHRVIPELQGEVHLELLPLHDIGTPELLPSHWTVLAEAIKRHYDQYEGFVVLHDTNTLVYTACALSFALQSLSKPIVLTGALAPLNDIGGDARMNLIYAIRSALLDVAEVVITLGPQILRGSRTKKVQQELTGSFASHCFPALGEFRTTGAALHPWRYVRRKRTLLCRSSFDPNVVTLTMTPGIREQVLDAVLDAGPRGIVLRSYGPGVVPPSFLPWLRRVADGGVPIVVTSQMTKGMIDFQDLKRQIAFERTSLISGHDMTHECAAVKLMWALTQAKGDRLCGLMERSLVGELGD